MNTETAPAPVVHQLRQILLGLAHREDELAATEASSVPYWSPAPASIQGHRAAAQALRDEAERFLEAC
jgi:hypothetical protein